MRRMRRGRRGLTLIEVMIALVILSSALVGMARFIGTFSHATKGVSNQQRALDLISNRLDSITRQPSYSAIDSMGSAGGITQSVTIDSTTYTRTTYLTHTGGGLTDTVDFKTVTVKVAQGSLAQPIEKTTIVAGH
jgi:prepilin-type N-terminal cleavage/methylation domain-containing protein